MIYNCAVSEVVKRGRLKICYLTVSWVQIPHCAYYFNHTLLCMIKLFIPKKYKHIVIFKY